MLFNKLKEWIMDFKNPPKRMMNVSNYVGYNEALREQIGNDLHALHLRVVNLEKEKNETKNTL